ncbi:MAG: hypothetical protein II836_02435 [Clostridia bacterium]|jgi:hypothetical protein|nr:hypothetical protein [Clostridia bacterium]
MELIVISDSQIKLTLSSDEWLRYRGSTGKVLRGIIDDAERLYGISRMDGRIYVQIYPSRAGGCELFVTRLGSLPSPLPDGEFTVTERRLTAIPARKYVYAFGEISGLLGCCADLSRAEYRGSSAAFVDRARRTYYLILDRENPAPGEHLGSLCPVEAVFYISEHCDVLCAENAAQKLGPFDSRAHYS